MSMRVLIFCVSAYFVEIVINDCRSKMARFQPSSFSRQFTSLELKDIRVTGKKPLGMGSDATVQEVNWLGTLCAAKRLHEILLEDDSPGGARRFIENFEKECMTWSRLVHPCIVQFLGVYFLSDSRVPMLILEKMDTSLWNYLKAHKKEEFPLPDKVYILRQVAQALSYLHSLSPPLVHHDLSPNNVLLNGISLHTKVTDFGMTRALDPSKMTRKSSVKGTQAFMPPEGLVDPPKYNEKLDIFSYGNIIITTTTHMWPNPEQPTKLEGKKLIAVSEFQRRQLYLDQFTPKESELFLPVVQACLQNDPSERPTSIQLVTQMSKIEEAHPRVPDSVVIGELHQTMDEKNSVIGQKDAQLCQKDALLDQKDALLDQKDAQLRQKDALLGQKDAQLHEKDAQLQKFQEEMKQLKQEASIVKQVSVCCVGMAYSLRILCISASGCSLLFMQSTYL